jgi:hypothetical protein
MKYVLGFLAVIALSFSSMVSAKIIEPDRLSAKNMGVDIKMHTVNTSDCEKYADLMRASAGLRDQGDSKDFVVQALLSNADISRSAYRALLPMLLVDIGDIFRTSAIKPNEVREIYSRSCKAHIGQELMYVEE